MAESDGSLIFEGLKSIQSRLDRMDLTLGEVKSELGSIRGHLIATESDVMNIYGVLARRDDWLQHIERRLDPRELAEAQRPYEPK
ncbi:hypothetical protein LB516_16575 [Mesorhizobium sp. CO1-1-7]|uniref:hypothetical protein n=1 Tax=unclassified Mesorhizobium TaxID=325217 RepID=UPI00112DA050|nr:MULTISPECIES: hypothetical protein [unclassified Mesorhizobium]MBZ9694215.1 hypothetical protein [Mesorhizobium sp. CO1-1-9]MBZ9746866.1 hypothetical protein [Mesorhizobium sp. CO1-1-7]TPK17991.1 hypothetical protein FJ543_05730 [Mesorhizobium sp. B2-5-7]